MVETSTKKKRVSKKKKSSWRKHVNIADVEEFLEDKRSKERTEPLSVTTTTDEVSEVDTPPSLKLLSAKERRKLKATRPLKCFLALQPYTEVPDPITKRNRVRTKEERKNYLVQLKEFKNKGKGIVKAKDVLALKNRELDNLRRKNLPKRGEFNTNLWNDDIKDNMVPDSQNQDDDWLTTNTKKHTLRGKGISIKRVRKSVRTKTSVLPAVEPPHPGMSYNPSFEDHQDLLRIVADKETQLIKKEKHLDRCTRGMFQKVTSDKRDSNWLIEMSEGLPSTDGSNIKENEHSDDEYTSINPPVVNKKKSLKQRRKQKEQMELERARQALKLEKKKITDIHKIKQLQGQVEKLEKKYNVSKEKRIKKKELKKNKTKILGSLKFEEPDLDFNMANELTGNLKNFKAEGNLLIDRFKSMQKRNILAPTTRQIRKKPKVKKYTKPGHKDGDWKNTVARYTNIQ